MRTVLAWSDKPAEREGAKNIVYDIAFRPDGLQLVAAVGMRVLVYDAVSGDMLHSLKGHKEAVHCVAYSADSKRFASGGADKQVIIWTSKAEGILKYAHTEPIQALCYNPLTHQLASATAGDFGLWSAEARSVPKHSLASRALCCSWTTDGQHIALGLFSGVVTIRDRIRPDVEKVRIDRPGGPVWSLRWNPSRVEQVDVLAVGCWDGTLSFFQLSGRQVGKDRELGYDPCCVSYFANGEYVVVGGSGRSAALWTKDGVKLAPICERGSWVWACQPRPRANFVAVGCQDGTIAIYAYRDNMTDVIVQHLATDERVRIKCRDYVRKVAVYKDKLAVQLPDKILLYELAHPDDATDMSYRPSERIGKKLECTLLVLTAAHVTLCLDRRLRLLDLRGELVREWDLEATIRYIKVIGGERAREGLLLGLESGTVVRVFVDNPFPTQLARVDAPVRCIDMSPSRSKLAVVDDNMVVRVFDLTTGAVTMTEQGGTSVAWNSALEDAFCFSGNGTLTVKMGTFPVHTDLAHGSVVRFTGSKIFCLHFVEMKTMHVPQTASLYQFLENGDYAGAARVACLDATASEWQHLGSEALRALELKSARQAFVRTRDLRLLDLVRAVEAARKAPGHDDQLLAADVLAHQGKFAEAARLYAKAGRADRAVAMFTELRQWDEAKRYSGTAGLANNADLAKRQAEWAEEVNDWKAAAETYAAAGDMLRAIRVLGDNGGAASAARLRELLRSLAPSARDELSACAMYLKKAGDAAGAREAYAKLGDAAALIGLAVEQGAWEEATDLARDHPQHAPAVYLPYADWLAVRDRFVEAQDAYTRAGRPDKAVRMLQALAHNATVEERFADAALYLHLIATERLRAARRGAAGADAAADGGVGGALAAGRPRGRAAIAHGAGSAAPFAEASAAVLAEYAELNGQAEIYYAYEMVHRFEREPFTTELAETIFQCCRFLLARTTHRCPFRVSRVSTLAALAKQAKALGAFKLSRQAYEKLSAYRLPPAWREHIDLQAISVRAKPFVDSEDLIAVCYRCQTTNPLLPPPGVGDECVVCRHPFARSFATFEPLPLVRFALPPHIFPQEAERLVSREPPPVAARAEAKANPWQGGGGGGGGGAQVLTLGDDGADAADDALGSDEPFMQALLDFDAGGGAFVPVEVDESMLLSFHKEEVFVQKWAGGGAAGGAALPWVWWKNMVPEIPISQCSACNRFFHGEEWEAAVLAKGQCPFCRAPQTAE
ncbi:hypothetical protein KFE25_012412 [Diacronema lutheri]|uniref:Intraflagellar transport protein 122 homolog n=1 Tax=Diacronema lutheri TaxID=2081491 RepID=A0A8J5XR26_DIALT|nr:hypothetical protein KFE25_012412 [Diacronema lutheri]